MFRIPKVILAIAVSWIICAIITAAGGFPNDSKIPQYKARTDARIAVLKEAKWFRFPYPGQKQIANHQIYRFLFLFLTANNLVIVMVRNSPEVGMGVVFSLAFVSILNPQSISSL